MGTFFVGGSGYRDDLILACVEGAGDAPNRTALASRVPPFDHDDRRDTLVPRPALQKVQAALLLGNLCIEAGAPQPLLQVEIVKHVELAIDAVEGACRVTAAEGA